MPRSKGEKEVSSTPSLLPVQIVSTVTPQSGVSEFKWREITKEGEKEKSFLRWLAHTKSGTERTLKGVYCCNRGVVR
jgi:hypothetical protein